MNARTIGRFATSIATLLVVAIGVPVALMAASTARFGSANPLAGVRPPWRWGWSTVGDAMSGPLADATVIDAIVRVSLCTVWLTVVITVATTAGEFVHAIRHRGLPLPEIRGLGGAQRLARYIAVGLVTVLPIMTPASSLAGTLEARPSPAAAPASPTEQATWARSDSPETTRAVRPAHGDDTRPGDPSIVSQRAATASPATAQPTTHLVGAGESIYSIAVAMAGTDTSRVTEIADAIIDANLGAEMPSGQRFTNPAYIETGWTMSVPAGLATGAPITSPAPAYSGFPVHAEADAGTHVVEPGETLWEIAEERLGDPTAWPQIWEDNDGDQMVDGRTFDDADLILPGWELELPDDEPAPSQHADDDTTVETVETVETAETVVVPVVELPDAADIDDQRHTADAVGPGVSLESGVDDVATSAPEDGAIVDGDLGTAPPSTSVPTPSTTMVPTTSTTALATDGREAGSSDEVGAVPGPQAPSPIRLEHAALLAAGVLALVGVRRRQRLRAARPHHRVPEPHPDLSETERRLRRVGAGERALRVDVACRAAAWSLIGTGCQIGWVLAAPDGAIRLRLTGPATLPAPWVGADQSWRLGAEAPVELLSEDARRVGQPCVALVQLGVTQDGDDVIVDLEAAGQVAIAAPAEQADEVITAVAASLASSIFAEVAHLIGVSLTAAAMLGHRNTHFTESSDAALDLATALTGTTTGNERTSFELRSLRTGGEMWEPAVVLLRGADGNDSDAEICAVEPGHGLAIVIADEQRRFDEVGARLVADPDGWRLDAFGATLPMTPIGVTQHDLTCLADLVADASRELEPVEQGDQVADDALAIESEPTPPFEPRPHEVVVGLLGAVDVRDRDGIAASFERSKTVELVAWLATHRDRATRSGARTALWEMDVRDATFANVVSEARRGLARLVAPPEGEEWVGRTLTEQLPLHHLVVTDADLVEGRLAHARIQPPSQAIETLRPAVELVREMPFAGTGYLWPDAEGLTSNLVMLAITATAEFAAHALSLGDTEGVFWSTGRGLRVLSGHEELIGLRMRAHARSGDLAGVRQEWESYERVLVGDAWSDGEPAPHLLELRRELLDHTSP